MSLNNNPVSMRIAEREKAFKQFRNMYHRLDQLVDALYRSGMYTVSEFDNMAREYRLLQARADKLEEKIRQQFPGKDLEEKIKWMKSNPRDESVGEETDTLYSWDFPEDDWIYADDDFNGEDKANRRRA